MSAKFWVVCALWVNFSLKFPVIYPIPKPYNTSLKDLFDLEGCVLPTLVENNMTNKPMRPKSIRGHFHSSTKYLRRLTNLLIY